MGSGDQFIDLMLSFPFFEKPGVSPVKSWSAASTSWWSVASGTIASGAWCKSCYMASLFFVCLLFTAAAISL